MAEVILIRRGTKAELDARGAMDVGELGFCTDTKEVYGGDAVSNYLIGRFMSGPYASRPAASVDGRFYLVTGGGTNDGYMYADTGSAWVTINAQSIVDLSGTLDDVADGTTYGKVKNTELTAGQVNRLNDGSNVVTAGDARAHIDDAAKHRVINDSGTGPDDLLSAQKIHNEIELAKQGMEYQNSVKNRDLSTPPGSPATGDRYIIKPTGTGAWVGHDNEIAEWNGSGWDFTATTTGLTCIVDDEEVQVTWNGSAWVRTGGNTQNIVAGSGLTGGGSGGTVTVNVGGGNGITITADAIAVKDGAGILVDASGVNANVDNHSIKIVGDQLTVGVVDGGTF